MNARQPLLLAALLLAGCGSSSALDETAGTAAVSPVVPTRVVDERGAGVGNVTAVLHERTTDAKYVFSSDPQGALALDLPPGVYDLGLNGADPTTATCFYGPVTLPLAASRTFVLHATGGRPPGTLFGRLDLDPGRPATNRPLRLVPTQISSSANPPDLTVVPSPVLLRTLADGGFSANLGSGEPIGLDVEVFNDDGTLAEWIDVYTLSKACYVEFATESSRVKNRLHSDQSDGPDAASLASRPPSRANELLARLTTKFTTANLLDNRFVFFGGVLTSDVSPVNRYSFPQLTDDPVDASLAHNFVTVTNQGGAYWHNNTASVYSAEFGVGGNYKFTDEANNTHALSFSDSLSYNAPNVGPLARGGVWGGGVLIPIPPQWHRVSYSSSQPNIGLIFAQTTGSNQDPGFVGTP